ncbi:MAG: DNA polymerase III subunit gamma/tau [Ruminococcaceae bacterium]|nr:DNA polymerase III subunit gamma/tau [Oscillospiraceae bacterium]
MYQALYRKWRPKTFADVIGQSHITETLQKQVAEERTSHAYLFTGTRGTGKTTCAKILAKAVNCEAPVNGNPCNRCPSCLGIENGNFLDVLELDAASNNGVDQVRALRDEAIYSPANVKKRVYIIDEVHMLTTAAFNALLKILEEPPRHLMFILATTELHKVLPTILSRCQRFSFKRIMPQDVALRLQYVAAQEQIDLTPDGAELLSRLSDGALRDGLSLLDQCAAVGGRVDSRAVLEMLGLAGSLQTAKLMEHAARRETQQALVLLDQLYTGGKDISAILGEMSALTRDLLLRKTAPGGSDALLSGAYDTATLDGLGKQVSGSRLLFWATALQQTTANLYFSANRRMDAELCLLQLCDESLSSDPTALSARIQRLEERIAVLPMTIRTQANMPVPEAPPACDEPAQTTAAQEAPPWEEPPLPEEPPLTNDAPWDEPPLPEEPPLPPESAPQPAFRTPEPSPAPKPAAKPAAPTPAAAPAADGGNMAVWQELAESCKGKLPPMYRVFLDMCRGTLTDNLITVYAPDDMTMGRLNNDRVLGALREQGEKLTGTPVQVRLQVGMPANATPEQLRKNLIQFGSQFDNITIK